MKLLKRESWWIWLLTYLLGNGVSMFLLGYLLNVYEKDAWYTKWQYWAIGFLCFILPFFIMLNIFIIQITANVAAKLGVSGKEYYLSPYVWILCLIIPIIGWILFVIMNLYLVIMIFVNLHAGNGEKYAQEGE